MKEEIRKTEPDKLKSELLVYLFLKAENEISPAVLGKSKVTIFRYVGELLDVLNDPSVKPSEKCWEVSFRKGSFFRDFDSVSLWGESFRTEIIKPHPAPKKHRERLLRMWFLIEEAYNSFDGEYYHRDDTEHSDYIRNKTERGIGKDDFEDLLSDMTELEYLPIFVSENRDELRENHRKRTGLPDRTLQRDLSTAFSVLETYYKIREGTLF